MTIDQQWYTSSAATKSGNPGFGVRAESGGITLEEGAAITRYHQYRIPPGREADVAGLPVSLAYYQLPSGRRGVSHVAYVGRDYTGRYGNFFAHTLLLETQDLGAVEGAAIALFGHGLWQTSEPESAGVDLPQIPALPRIGPVAPSAVAGFFEADPGRERVLAVLFQVLADVETSRKRLLIADGADAIPRWILSVMAGLPAAVRASITFNTYPYDLAAASEDIVGAPVGDDPAVGQVRHVRSVIDPHGSPPPDVTVSMPAIRLARMVARGDDEQAARLWGIAGDLGVTDIGRYFDCVLLDAALSDAPSTEEGADRVTALLGGAPTSGAAPYALRLVPMLGSTIPVSRSLSVLRTAQEVCAAEGMSVAFGGVVAMAAAADLDLRHAAGWVGMLAEIPAQNVVRQIIARDLMPAQWQDALVAEMASGELSPIWWILDQWLPSADEIEAEECLVRLAGEAASRGSRPYTEAVLGSLRDWARTHDEAALRCYTAIKGDVAPLCTATYVADLCAAAQRALAVSVAAAKPWESLAAETLADHHSDSVLATIISASSEWPDSAARVAAMTVARDPQYARSMAQQLHRVGGASGGRIRATLMVTEGGEELVRQMAQLDLAGFPPSQVVSFWVDPRSMTLSPQQELVICEALDRLDGAVDGDREWHVISESLRGRRLPENIELRLRLREIASGPVSPLNSSEHALVKRGIDTGMLREAAVSSRMAVRMWLTQLADAIDQGKPPTALYARLAIEAAGVTVADYAAFLKQAFKMLSGRRINPPAQLAAPTPIYRPDMVGVFIEALGRYYADCERFTPPNDLAYVARTNAEEFGRLVGKSAERDFMKALPRATRGALKELLAPDKGPGLIDRLKRKGEGRR